MEIYPSKIKRGGRPLNKKTRKKRMKRNMKGGRSILSTDGYWLICDNPHCYKCHNDEEKVRINSEASDKESLETPNATDNSAFFCYPIKELEKYNILYKNFNEDGLSSSGFGSNTLNLDNYNPSLPAQKEDIFKLYQNILKYIASQSPSIDKQDAIKILNSLGRRVEKFGPPGIINLPDIYKKGWRGSFKKKQVIDRDTSKQLIQKEIEELIDKSGEEEDFRNTFNSAREIYNSIDEFKDAVFNLDSFKSIDKNTEKIITKLLLNIREEEEKTAATEDIEKVWKNIGEMKKDMEIEIIDPIKYNEDIKSVNIEKKTTNTTLDHTTSQIEKLFNTTQNINLFVEKIRNIYGFDNCKIIISLQGSNEILFEIEQNDQANFKYNTEILIENNIKSEFIDTFKLLKKYHLPHASNIKLEGNEERLSYYHLCEDYTNVKKAVDDINISDNSNEYLKKCIKLIQNDSDKELKYKWLEFYHKSFHDNFSEIQQKSNIKDILDKNVKVLCEDDNQDDDLEILKQNKISNQVLLRLLLLSEKYYYEPEEIINIEYGDDENRGKLIQNIFDNIYILDRSISIPKIVDSEGENLFNIDRQITSKIKKKLLQNILSFISNEKYKEIENKSNLDIIIRILITYILNNSILQANIDVANNNFKRSIQYIYYNYNNSKTQITQIHDDEKILQLQGERKQKEIEEENEYNYKIVPTSKSDIYYTILMNNKNRIINQILTVCLIKKNFPDFDTFLNIDRDDNDAEKNKLLDIQYVLLRYCSEIIYFTEYSLNIAIKFTQAPDLGLINHVSNKIKNNKGLKLKSKQGESARPETNIFNILDYEVHEGDITNYLDTIMKNIFDTTKNTIDNLTRGFNFLNQIQERATLNKYDTNKMITYGDNKFEKFWDDTFIKVQSFPPNSKIDYLFKINNIIFDDVNIDNRLVIDIQKYNIISTDTIINDDGVELKKIIQKIKDIILNPAHSSTENKTENKLKLVHMYKLITEDQIENIRQIINFDREYDMLFKENLYIRLPKQKYYEEHRKKNNINTLFNGIFNDELPNVKTIETKPTLLYCPKCSKVEQGHGELGGEKTWDWNHMAETVTIDRGGGSGNLLFLENSAYRVVNGKYKNYNHTKKRIADKLQILDKWVDKYPKKIGVVGVDEFRIQENSTKQSFLNKEKVRTLEKLLEEKEEIGEEAKNVKNNAQAVGEHVLVLYKMLSEMRNDIRRHKRTVKTQMTKKIPSVKKVIRRAELSFNTPKIKTISNFISKGEKKKKMKKKRKKKKKPLEASKLLA